MSDLVKRLRDRALPVLGLKVDPLSEEAATRIERLEAFVERVKEIDAAHNTIYDFWAFVREALRELEAE